MKPRLRSLAPRCRRLLAITAILAVLLAGVITTRVERGATLTALPGATAQPEPSGPTGGPGGGGGPPFPLQPPEMPGPPSAYNSGSYPAPDQGNGISIYNSNAPQSPGSQGSYSQAPNHPQQLQPANGTQPPDYDAPLQQQRQPSVAPSPRSEAPQQQPTEQPEQLQDTQQADQRQQQCQAAADFYHITQMVWNTTGSAGSLAGGRPMPGRNGPGVGQCNCAPDQVGPQTKQPSTPEDQPQEKCDLPDDDSGADTAARNSEIMVATSDSQGRLTILRRGYYDPAARNGKGRGFGYDKLYHKHGLTNLDSIYALIQKLKDPQPCGGSAIEYETPINEWMCDPLGCESQHIADLRTVVETANQGEPDGKQKGIITMYCEGTIVCPPIMNTIPRDPH